MLKRFKRAGVWALAVAMAVTMTPASAFATDAGAPEGAPGPDESNPVVQEGETPGAGDTFVAEDGETPAVAEEGALTVADDKDEPEAEKAKDPEVVTEVSSSAIIDEFVDIETMNPLTYGTLYKGLFRPYDGKNRWGEETVPKMPQLTTGTLKEGTDFTREYIYCKDGAEVMNAYYYSQNHRYVDEDDDSGVIFSEAEKTYTFLPAEEAEKMTEPGYILERIRGLGDFEDCSYMYALHGITLDVTITTDDIYKVVSGDPEKPSPDPEFTVEQTIGDYPKDIDLSGSVYYLWSSIRVTRADAESSTKVEKAGTTVDLIPEPNVESQSYRVLDMVEKSGKTTATLMSFSEGHGLNFGDSETEYVNPPISLTLVPGTLYLEDDTPLPASQSRVVKQMEATNLVSKNGKYTTTVKMSLPFNKDTDPKKYYEEYYGGTGFMYDLSDEPSQAVAASEDSLDTQAGTATATRTRSGTKQNEILTPSTMVVMKLSPDFRLPSDENGDPDLSGLKLVDYAYSQMREGHDEIPSSAYEKKMKEFQMNYVLNGEPEKDGRGYYVYDFKGYKLDSDEYKKVYGTDDVVIYGFGLTRPSGTKYDEDTREYYLPDLSEKEIADLISDPINYMFGVVYLPSGIGEVPEDAQSTAAIDLSLLKDPCIVLTYSGSRNGSLGALSPLNYITLEFQEELTNVKTADGVYGSYDQYGTRGGSDIKVLDSALLLRTRVASSYYYGQSVENDPDYRGEVTPDMPPLIHEKPEKFYIPTVSYTVGGNGGSNSGGGRASGGGGASVTPVTVLPEPEVPLAETPELNKTDHVAYVIGYEDGTVKPENLITRAEVATIFYRLLTDDSRKAILSSSNSFKDTVAGAWYNKAVSTLTKGGILSGYTDGTFMPSGNITRAEFATIAARFDTSEVSTANVSFKDISGHWAEQNIKRAAALGYITGYEDGSFKPNEPITRAEAMTMLNRVLGRDKITADGLLDTMSRWSDCPTTAWYYLAVQEATNTHEYTLADGIETWTAVTANPDWSNI